MDRQQIREHLTGPVASTPTTFLRDGSIDFAGLRNFLDFVIDGGAKSVILTYGDSLCTLLSDQDLAEVTKCVAEHVRGRALVVAADRSWWMGKEVEFARYAREVGADVFMALPPDWAASCTSRTLADYYAAVAQEMPLMLVTGLFARRGIDFGMETLRLVLEEVDGVVAVKDDVCGEFGRKLGLLCHDEWAMVSGGQKQNHLDMLPYGCDAYLATFIKFAPTVTQQYWAAIEADDISTATGIIEQYDMPFFDFIARLPGGFDAGMHGCLELFGVAQRWRRPPYHSLSDEEMEKLGGFFQGMGLL